MSNHLAVATATATLQRILQRAVQRDVDGARVTTVRPDGSSGSIPETGVNLYLYHIKRNPALTNQDTPNFQRRGDMTRRRQAAIDLFYVVSFYGNDGDLEPQRLLGSVVQTLEDQLVLSADTIRATIADPTFTYLADSDLAEQVEQIRSEFISVSTDELSKIWSVFFQTPYALSLVYKVTVIIIESDIAGRSALPVRDRILGSTVFPKQPIITQVVAVGGKNQPIFSNSILSIRGQHLSGVLTQIRIGELEITPQVVNSGELRLPLSLIETDQLRAGVQSLQVIHLQAPPAPPRNGSRSSRRGTTATTNRNTPARVPQVESNVAPFVLRPTIETVTVLDLDGFDDEPRSGTLSISLNLAIAPGQRIVVMMNECSPNSNNPIGYLFTAPPITRATATVSIPIREVKPGEYLVRVQIDGAESILSVDDNPDSPTFEQYIQPKVAIN
ncbi:MULTISPECIES: DUF4255 domain-containing protein [Limnospira]|uniref:Pvc16 N-terminal domain-containing protein n=1 Tax=Limnospira indica PCC 8005 TaxID=376219 RepID=A0A9P1NYF5_9CYAN|nr:DUF4255 domain-containing protein [Limnospira indica]CDM92438.1 conserved hypothetical protein [Limnospira indica PCC 8005]